MATVFSVLLVVLAALLASAAAVDMATPMRALVSSFAELEQHVSVAAAQHATTTTTTSTSTEEPMNGEDLKALLQTVKIQLSTADPKEIPAALLSQITTLTEQVQGLSLKMRALTDIHFNETIKANETFATPGNPRVGFVQNTTSGADADRLINIFKITQKTRKISKQEVETMMPGHVDTKPGF